MSIINKYSNLIHKVPVKSVKVPSVLPMKTHWELIHQVPVGSSHRELIQQVRVGSVKVPLFHPMESHQELGITREEIEEASLGLEWWEIVLRKIPDNCTLLCSQVDGFRGMPAALDTKNSSGYGGAASARDSADSSSYGGGVPGYEAAADKGSATSGYGGAADKGMTMVKIINLPEKGTSKHELYELFKTSGSARESADSSGYGGAADKGSVALGYGGTADKGMTTVKPGDAPESGRGWIRDTSRLFWEKPIEDTPVRGRHTSKSEHQFQSNRKSNRKGADGNRSQFGYGRPYW